MKNSTKMLSIVVKGLAYAILITLVVWAKNGVAETVTARAPGQDRANGEDEPSVELMTWGKDTIIHRGRKDIYLSHYSPQYSVAVLIVNDVPWTQSGLRNLSGQFTVHAPAGQGLMGVVQVLNLRSDSSSCRDFLQFQDPSTAIQSPRICGNLSKDNKKFMPNEIIGSRVFHSPSGAIQVQYRSDKGDPDQKHENDMSFHMVELVFTAYKDCERLGLLTERECGESCISPLLTCDDRINCGFEEDFAVDEIGCEDEESDRRESGRVYLISLYLGAVIFLLILSLVACYHHRSAYRRMKNIPH